jgi:hypothetical protein
MKREKWIADGWKTGDAERRPNRGRTRPNKEWTLHINKDSFRGVMALHINEF